MTKAELKELLDSFDVEKVDYWECPADNGVPILTMPNIPMALHGKGLQPRTVYGRTTWDFMRKAAYQKAGYASEISGEVPEKGYLHSHELFSYDYARQEGVFIRCIALSKLEHDFIHSGRLITLYRMNNPIVPKSYLLKVVENGFKLVHDYNEAHPDQEPLRVYATFLEYLDRDDLRDEMVELIHKYDIKFYKEHIPKSKRWRGWHVIIGNKRYNSPYTCQKDWEAAMQEANKQDTVRSINTPFTGKGFDMVDAILKEANKVTKIPGCKPGRLSKRKTTKGE